jgi:hypothetical protein
VTKKAEGKCIKTRREIIEKGRRVEGNELKKRRRKMHKKEKNKK